MSNPNLVEDGNLGDQPWADVVRNQEPLPNVYDNSDFAKGIIQGRYLEQERIIKLPEEHQPIGFIDGTVECRCGSTVPYQLHLIALIKGENK